MRTLVAFPSTAIFGQQAALAFAEREALAAYVTTFAWRNDTRLAKLLVAAGPAGRKIVRELSRREVAILPADKVETHPLWELLLTLAAKSGVGSLAVDRIWDHMSHVFTREVGKRLRHEVEAVYAYEYTALEAFAAAKRRGVARILDFPSLNSRQYQQLQSAQKALYPELRGGDDAYYDRVFERRQARRDAEMQAADIVITNSSVTRASHIAGGADPARTFAVPYGAPPTIGAVAADRDVTGPLRVVWAGTFSIRKAAHLFVDAWRDSSLRRDAAADIYGAVTLPARMVEPVPAGMTFHGSVVRPVLFDAFERADVLMFPTLSDGFGMVVTEAFARGLPVITTDQAGASDFVRHGENGLIIPAGDTTAIGDALRWCLDYRGELAAMREAALATAKGWQWSDYRQALFDTVQAGLVEAGYSDPAVRTEK
jgi:glycosyltransferase involved in cell wall biosynthesis